MPTEDPLSILFIVAHPHDFTHAAGTCGHHVAAGDRVAVVFLTGGGTTHNERLYDEMLKDPDQRDPRVLQQSHAEYAAAKAEEMRAACELFGIQDVTIYPYEDNFIQVTDRMIEDVTAIICDRRPDIVITQRPEHARRQQVRQPDDHFITAEVAHTAIMRAIRVTAGSGMRPHEVTQIFYIGVDSGPFEIDLFVDITDDIEKRVQAEALFTTQGSTPAKSRRKVELITGFYGWYARVPFAEPFIRANAELTSRLPLSPTQRAISHEPHGERIMRLGREN